MSVVGAGLLTQANASSQAPERTDSLRRVIPIDSLPVGVPVEIGTDSVAAVSLSDSSEVVTRGDSVVVVEGGMKLEGPVIGSVQDSLVYDVRGRHLYKYKTAQLQYTDLKMNADYIKMDFNTNDVEAHGTYDTIQEKYLRPVFVQDQTEYELDSVRYNVSSKKALIWGVRTQEGDGFITGGLVKKMPDDVIHMKGGRYTTCDLECPHYYLQMTKGTVEPHKKVVFGPAYMVFEDVPFYILGVPFGFFPQQGSRKSGFIVPSFGEEQTRGFYLREGGFYFVFNDYVDVKLLGGIYTLGSWEFGVESNYKKRYKYSGNLQFDFAKDIFGEKGSADYVNQKNVKLVWTHRQDSKFRPNSTFSASVNYASSKYNQYNATNMNDYLSSQTSSSIAYSKNWAGKPFSLSVNMSHSQSLIDSSMSMTFPSAVFNVSRVNPFKRKVQLGKERWYEKISFTYQAQLQNTANFKSDEFMKKEMIDNMRYGVQHQLPISASFTALKYFNITPGASYTERWYFRKIYREWDPNSGQVQVGDTTKGFYRVFNYNFSVSANTRMYMTYTFGKGAKPARLRHMITPTISFTYTPDFGKAKYGYYETIQKNKEGETMTYSPFQNELYGVPSNGAAMALNFSIGNTLELKVPSDRDTTGYRKIKLIEALNISSGYNFLLDSLRLSPFSVSLRTTLFKGVNLNVSSTFDPYQVDENGRRINKFFIRTRKGLARLTNVSTSFGYSFSSPARRKSDVPASNNPDNNAWQATNHAADMMESNEATFFTQTENQYATSMRRAQMLASQYYDFDIPWSVGLSYSFGWSRSGKRINQTQTVSFNGSVNLTEKWAVEFGAGYDIVKGKLTPGTVMLRRDMHCWQATFSWVPVGFRQSWNFAIRIKSQVLADLLKYRKSRSFLDNFYYY